MQLTTHTDYSLRLLIGRRHPAKVAMGDTFAVLAVPL